MLGVTVAGIPLQNPVIPASGTFGYGYEMARFFDLNRLGGIALKGTTWEARYGNELPRIAECESGMLNAIGLQNPGAQAVVADELPRLACVFTGPLIANVSGFSIDEYIKTALCFDDHADILEINVSCPNVKHGGMAFGVSPEGAASVCRAVKSACKTPVFMKLSPNVTDIAEIAMACEEAGADGISLINTLLGMVIDPKSGKPIVSTKMAGFSGPAVKPVAVRMVYQVYERVGIPIIGAGGIATADDVIEMMSAGASAVQVGTQNLVDPWACIRILDDLPRKLSEYGIDTISKIIGRAHG
ncbi:MAG: dihydroorotate dehydrogenase [Clostridia bacterium]|nr:dihydroorotate dehydrogenase [Clostridia bacterium]